MSFSIFINFQGNCKEAIDFYSKVFKSEIEGLMTYDQMPTSPDYPIKEEDKKKISYCHIPIFGTTVMFCDIPEEMPLVVGNNISPTISCKDESEIQRVFSELKTDGNIIMDLQKTFWSNLYGMVTDKFGITWQIMVEDYPVD